MIGREELGYKEGKEMTLESTSAEGEDMNPYYDDIRPVDMEKLACRWRVDNSVVLLMDIAKLLKSLHVLAPGV